MKFKLGLLFAVVTVIAVFGVFYTKDYISYDVLKPQLQKQDEKTLGVFNKGIEATYVDYQDNPISKSLILVELEDRYTRGEVIIVHFWASWCAPCVNEIPEIISFMESEMNTNPKIHFIAVNLDSEIEDIQKFLKSFPELDKPPFLRIWDKENVLSKYFDVDKLPATILFQNTKPYRKINGVVEWGKTKFK